jgi:hypothetical protein
MRTTRTQTHHRIRRMLHEIVERSAIIEDIKALYVSLLSQAQGFLHLGELGSVDNVTLTGFHLRATKILDDVRGAIRDLGSGEEEQRLLRQADQVEGIIRRVADVCLDDDLLVERWR